MRIILLWTISVLAAAETLQYLDATYNFTFTQIANYFPNLMPNGTSHPYNYFQYLTISTNHVYLLDASSGIEVYFRCDPASLVKEINNYRYNASFMALAHAVYSLDGNLAVLVRSANS